MIKHVSISSGSGSIAPRALLALVGAIALVSFGCATTEEAAEPPPQPKSEFTQNEPAPTRPTPTAQSIGKLETVYFDFDKATLREDAREKLRANAKQILAGSGTVTIEGHCDERGSEEYNLALGERRANSVRQYLGNLGVPSSRMRVISYGEAKPAVQGHDESAWRWNRRAGFRSDG